MPRASVTLKMVDRGWTRFASLIKEIEQQDLHVKVGVLEGVGHGSDKREGGITNAELAAVHEFGTANIPERSFIRATFTANRVAYIEFLKIMLTRVVEGRMKLDDAFNALGLKISTDIKKYVTAGAQVPPPNAPSTFARKAARSRRGKNRSVYGDVRTLIDTGRMIASVTWALARGK